MNVASTHSNARPMDLAIAARIDALGEILSPGRYPSLCERHYAHLAAWVAERTAQSDESGWRPIDQILPVDGEKVLLWIEREPGIEIGMVGMVEAFWSSVHGEWETYTELAGEPTHFMRIAPPSAGGGA